MKILVVGHNSLVARHLLLKLGEYHTLFFAGRGSGFHMHFDLLDETDVFINVPRCDALIHCAASFEPDTIKGAELNERSNSLGCFQVSKLAVECACNHVIYLGSISSLNHPENEYYGSYSISKAHGENNLEFCCRLNGICFTSLRLSQIYDDLGEAAKHQPLLYKIIENAKAGNDIIFYGNKDPLRNFIHIDDVVQIIELTLLTQAEGIHPILFPKSYTLSEIAFLASKTFITEPNIIFLKDKPDIKTIHLPVMSDFYQHLGYMPSIDLAAGMLRIRENLYASST